MYVIMYLCLWLLHVSLKCPVSGVLPLVIDDMMSLLLWEYYYHGIPNYHQYIMKNCLQYSTILSYTIVYYRVSSNKKFATPNAKHKTQTPSRKRWLCTTCGKRITRPTRAQCWAAWNAWTPWGSGATWLICATRAGVFSRTKMKNHLSSGKRPRSPPGTINTGDTMNSTNTIILFILQYWCYSCDW